MVAKAKGDLFDVNVGGAGFHVTSHLIALAALFIACFAIAGYISYRTDSVPASALKDQSEVLTKKGETWTFEKEFELSTLVQTTAGDVVAKTGLVLPADALIVGSTLLVQVAGVGQTGAAQTLLYRDSIGLSVGTAVTGGAGELTVPTGMALTNLQTRGSVAGKGTGVGALSASQEVYFGTKTAAFSFQGTTNPKVIATVQWTGSAPVAY